MAAQKATHQLTKQHNRDLVLRTIFEHESISRAEIARQTQLTRATVSDLVAELIEAGLVEEVGYGSSSGGKNPILLVLKANSRYLIGCNLAQDRFIGSVVNLRGQIMETVEIPFTGTDGQQALAHVYEILDQLTTKTWQPIVGIGVGTPGLVNTRAGVVVDAVNLNWQDVPLARLLTDRYHLPVTVLNDSQATAIGEFVYSGNYRSDENAIVINIKHGIGAGILINGRLFQGDGGGAGEIGHILVEEDGPACRCGRKGCLETIANTRAIIQRTEALLPEYPASILSGHTSEIGLNDIEKAYHQQDALAVRVISDAAAAMGKSIASLVGTLNIRKIVFTGYMNKFGQRWLDQIQQSMQASSLTRLAADTRLEMGDLGFKACVLGSSAYMLLDDYSLLFTPGGRS